MWVFFGVPVVKKRTQVEEMMEQINSQNRQGVVRGVPRVTCPLFGDKKEQQMFCFYETSHMHDPTAQAPYDGLAQTTKDSLFLTFEITN